MISDLHIEETNTKLDELYLNSVTKLSEAHSHVIYDEQVSQQLMKNLGYYDRDISQMFTLFDGVANPFHFVKVQPGQDVLDLHCGIGVDALIAKKYSGSGMVTAIDREQNEIEIAKEIANTRDVDVKFLQLSSEEFFKINDPDLDTTKKYDVVMSNGPTVMHKWKQERMVNVLKTLKPGGRMVFSSCALLKPLEDGVKYPEGIEKLMLIDDIRPMLEQIGYLNVGVDMSNRKLAFEVEYQQVYKTEKEKKMVYVGPESFSDPKYDFAHKLNDRVARVTIVGTKASD